MIRHCVMFTWADGVTDDHKKAIYDGLDQLAGLPGVVSYTYGPDAGLAEGNADFMVVGDFVDDDAYVGYHDDPGHRELIANHIIPAIAGRSAIQYRIS